MVWNHMAELHRDVVADLADPGGPSTCRSLRLARPKIDDRAVDRAKKKVIECLEQSLELAPDHLPTYRLLVEVYRGWDDPAGLEAAAAPAAGEVSGGPGDPDAAGSNIPRSKRTGRGLAVRPEGARAQAARRVVARAGMDDPGRPGPQPRARRALGRGTRAIQGRRGVVARLPAPDTSTWPARSSSRRRPARPTRATGYLRASPGQPGRADTPVAALC